MEWEVGFIPRLNGAGILLAIISASPAASLSELVQQMRDENVGSVVITNDKKLLGIATDRDPTTRLLANETNPTYLTAEDIVSEALSSQRANSS